ILSQRRLERGGKRTRIARHFSLRDRALLVVVHEFDRFLDCYDVLRKVLIDIIDYAGGASRFARASWTGNKDKAAAQMRELFYNDGNPQLLQRGNLRRDQTKNRAITIRLLEIV